MKYKVVIVNYKKDKSVISLLRQLEVQELKPVSVFIADNSPDPTLKDTIERGDWSLSLEIKEYPENVGYSKGCNAGQQGVWDLIVFLNPDIEIQDRSLFLRLSEELMELGAVGCVGVSQRNPDGSFEAVARRFPTPLAVIGKRIPILRPLLRESVRKYMKSYACEFNPDGKPLEVDWLQSSFLAVPRQVWSRQGGFDERYFVFMADTEYGHRCNRNGLKSYFIPALQVEADGVRASEGGVLAIFKSKVIRIHIKDSIRYYLSLLQKK
ncbi:hypothetical protein ABE488_12360 [Luteimonas sp. TWI662]|uniref:glycosyltransferase family 2 protein n=1 Tax=Luteimonas sp. TWI662 TaxID=3136789 RepID=UPI0032096B65